MHQMLILVGRMNNMRLGLLCTNGTVNERFFKLLSVKIDVLNHKGGGVAV